MAQADSFFFFATVNGEVAAYMKLNHGSAQTQPQGSEAIELERLSVDSAFHGLAVAPCLLATAFELVRSLGRERMWLGVWEENARAIAFYEKHGFATFSEHVFRPGADAQRDLLMHRTTGSR